MNRINYLANFDQYLFLRLSVLREYIAFKHIARAVSMSGDGYLQVLVLFALSMTYTGQTLELIKIMAVIFATERALYWVLKNGIKRKRPMAALTSFKASITASDEFSFPSGHTSAACLLMFTASTLAPWLFIPLSIWAGCVGLSRVVLGVHFPADILAGMSLGLSVGWLYSPLLINTIT